jgi:hypothetical protein
MGSGGFTGFGKIADLGKTLDQLASIDRTPAAVPRRASAIARIVFFTP